MASARVRADMARLRPAQLPVAVLLTGTLCATAAPAGAAPPWSPPVVVGPFASPRLGAQLAVAPDGGRLVAWNDVGARADRTRLAFAPGRSRALGARLAAAPVAVGSGRFALLRENEIDGRTRLFASSVFPSGVLGAVTVLARDLVPGHATQAVDARGDVAVAWVEQAQGQDARVRLALRRRGGRFGPTRTLATGQTFSGVTVALSARGHLVAAYGGRRARGWRIEVRSGATRGGLRTPQVLGPGGGGDDITAAVDPRGRAVVAWGAQDTGEEAGRAFVVSAAIRSSRARRFRGRQVLDAGGRREFPRGGLRIVMADDGSATLAWTQVQRRGQVVRTSVSDQGGRFAAPTEPGSGHQGEAYGADLAIGADGRRALVWVSEAAGQRRVLAATAARRGAWDSAEEVVASAAATGPRIAFVPAGGLTVVWTDYRGQAPSDVRLAERALVP